MLANTGQEDDSAPVPGELRHPGQEEQVSKDGQKKRRMLETEETISTETVPSAAATKVWSGLSYHSSAITAADESRAGALCSGTSTRNMTTAGAQRKSDGCYVRIQGGVLPPR